MGQKFAEVSQKIKKSMQDPGKKKSWQSGIGITIFALFVLSSVVVNRSVQALNQAAGSYGYYSGTYGYGGSTGTGTVTTSDAPPSAPTSLSTSSIQQTSATVSWTAPTTTTAGTAISTGGGSISTYLIHYSTSAQSGCSGGTSTTSTSASVALSSLTAGTTYNVAVCARDNNLNDSLAGTVSFTTQSSGGGTAATVGSTGGGGGAAAGPTFPTATPTPAPAPAAPTPAVTPAAPAPAATVTKVQASARELIGADLPAATASVAAQFVAGSGVPTAVAAFGAGELNAIARDVIQITKTFSLANAIAIASGQKPPERNHTAEQRQLPEVLAAFVKLTGHRPNFKDPKQDLAWNTLQYRVRFKRNLLKEKCGITKFKLLFKRNPKSPLDWSVVRAQGYALGGC